MVEKPRWHWSGISSFIYPWCGYPWCPWPSTQALLYLLPSKYLFLPSLQAHSSEKTFSIISLSVDLYRLSGSDPLLLIYNSKNVFLPVLTYSMSGLPVVTQHWKRKGQHLLTSHQNALSPVMIFTQGRTLFCFHITLRWYFKLEIIYESASLFNLKEKKIDVYN